MKVSIGFKFTKEAYGGGNNFVKNLTFIFYSKMVMKLLII